MMRVFVYAALALQAFLDIKHKKNRAFLIVIIILAIIFAVSDGGCMRLLGFAPAILFLVAELMGAAEWQDVWAVGLLGLGEGIYNCFTVVILSLLMCMAAGLVMRIRKGKREQEREKREVVVFTPFLLVSALICMAL